MKGPRRENRLILGRNPPPLAVHWPRLVGGFGGMQTASRRISDPESQGRREPKEENLNFLFICLFTSSRRPRLEMHQRAVRAA